MSRVGCHFHILVMVKEKLRDWVRPVREVSASHQFSSLLASCGHRAAHKLRPKAVCQGVFVEFLGAGRWVSKDVAVTDHWQEAQLSVSVNNSAHSSFNSTDELLRETLLARWREGPDVFESGLVLSWLIVLFKLKEKVMALVKSCMCLLHKVPHLQKSRFVV